jgi:hypothetical protein
MIKHSLKFSGFILLVTITIFLFFNSNLLGSTADAIADTSIPLTSSTYNSTLLFADEKHNIIAAGDWACNAESQRTMDNVLEFNPDLIITAGDHVANATSAECWTAMSAQIRDKMKIAIGNHDVEFEIIYSGIARN